MVLFVGGSCVRSNRRLGGLEIQEGGYSDWLEEVGEERFLEKLFELELDGIFRFEV